MASDQSTQAKQCTKCGARYPREMKACPECGYSGWVLSRGQQARRIPTPSAQASATPGSEAGELQRASPRAAPPASGRGATTDDQDRPEAQPTASEPPAQHDAWREWQSSGTLHCRKCGQTVVLGPGAAEKAYRDKLELARMLGMSRQKVLDRLRRESPTWKHAECGEVQPYPEPPDPNAFLRSL